MPVPSSELIEAKIDRAEAASTEVSMSMGGIRFSSMLEVMEAAKLLSISGPAIPKWLQNNPGGCWAVMIQAIEWKMSPIAVARMSYEVNGVVGYMSQMIHAIVEARAPLKNRLRFTYEGEGDGRTCTVTGHLKGEVDSISVTTPPVGKITPKNSPLWKSDIDQQLSYYGARTWCRRYVPDILMGVYDRDEVAAVAADEAKDITPAIADRLKEAKAKPRTRKRRGFDADHVEAEAKKMAVGTSEADTTALVAAAEVPAKAEEKPEAKEPTMPSENPDLLAVDRMEEMVEPVDTDKELVGDGSSPVADQGAVVPQQAAPVPSPAEADPAPPPTHKNVLLAEAMNAALGNVDDQREFMNTWGTMEKSVREATPKIDQIDLISIYSAQKQRVFEAMDAKEVADFCDGKVAEITARYSGGDAS